MRPNSLCAATSGAVFVEKLIAYLPLLLTFFATWELAELCAASLVVERASAAAGRAAVVVLPDDPAFYGGEDVDQYAGARRQDIELAATLVLSALPRLDADVQVDVSDPPVGVGPIDVTVTAQYSCGLVSLICGGDGAIELTSTTTHTHHGAHYPYSSPASIAGSEAALTSTGFRASTRPPPGSSSNTPCTPSCDAKRNLRPDNKPDPKAKCRSVWRYDRRSPGEVFAGGFSAWGTSQDLGLHVEGSHIKDSGFVSTSKDKRTAFKLLWQAERPGRPLGCVYEIRECGCGMDVQKTLKGCETRPGVASKVDQYAYQKEVAIPGRVESEDIVQVICPTSDTRPKPYQLPPNPSASDIKKYADWPPLSSIKASGPATKNSRYDKNDSARKNRPCRF
jgi:hypothetical protein